MKKKNPMNKLYSFQSVSPSRVFMERIKREANNSNLNIDQIENGFDLQLGSDHCGRIIYRANVSADENGGSLICGEMITIPWSSKPQKKKNLFQKILSILGYIIFIPIGLIILLIYGIYSLFARLFHRKNIELTDEEKLCDFMTNKMCCEPM